MSTTIPLDEARTALRHQAAELRDVRYRSLAVLALSLLAALDIDHVVGSLNLLATAVLVAVIHWPRKLTFVEDAHILHSWISDYDVTPEDMPYHLSRQMDQQYEANKPKVDMAYRLNSYAMALFVAQVLLLGVLAL